MSKVFQEKSGKVIVAEQSGATRALLVEVVRGLGFKDVTGVPSIKDALSMLEVEPIIWCIVPLGADQNENAMHVLQICLQNPELRDLRVSILIEESEMYCLPAAFEKGLISWHQKPFTKDSIKSDFANFIKRLEDYQWDVSLVAGDYLREQLVLNQSYEDLLKFERSLAETYPMRADLLLNCAIPLVKAERKDEAKLMLRRAMLLDPSLEARVNDIAAKYLDGDYKGGAGETDNVLGLERVLVVDSDEAVHKNVKEVLEEIGVKDVEAFVDGEAALKHLEDHPHPSLILQEWRIPKVPGPLFIQRAKSKGAQNVPIIVISSLIQSEDMPFVREMGVAAIVNKPVDRALLLRTLVNTVMQDRAPTDQYALERKIRELLVAKNLKDARELFDHYKSNDKVPVGMKKTMEAEICLASGEFENARNFGIEAIKMNGDSLFALNLLGKALMHLKDYAAAVRCFEKAQSLSPLNIERLCNLAEVQSEMGDVKSAEESLEKAKDVDSGSERVKEAEAKVAVNSGDSERAKKIMKQLDSLSNVVAYMNNQAVSWARAGHVDRGIEQYHKTLRAIPDEKSEVIATVDYNLALAHVRAGQYDEARGYLEKSLEKGLFKVSGKAKSLLARLRRALETGSKIVIRNESHENHHGDSDQSAETTKSAAIPIEAAAKEHRDIVSRISARRGEIGCFMIFNPTTIDTRARVLFDNPPRFNTRRAITREVSMGADKMLKSGS